ncbi:MAG: TrkH family potassium uptake protein [Bacillales bacterium]|nr:TrkH family potassium uptake protein [Bacillales bacterium]
MRSITHKLSPIRFIAIGYFTAIIIGALLLILPISAKSGTFTNFLDALFTSTSAVCVTGLTTLNTATHWTFFGQLVILILIQIGGLGIMTVITLLFLLLRKSIGLYERTILIQSAGTFSFHGIVTLIKRILIGTFIFEFIGALVLSIRFIPQFGVTKGIWYSIFHAVSAFCNAGFDLFGNSLADFKTDPLVLITLSLLIIIGGLGFLVWSELYDSKRNFSFKRLSLHTKIVLVYNTSLLFLSAIIFFIVEYNHGLSGLTIGQKILDSWFMAVTPRTAGFSIIEQSSYSQGGTLLTIILMFIGGNPGSTAGGVKTTTILVVLLNIIASAKQKDDVCLFKKKISNKIIKQSSALVLIYLCASIIASLIICAIEPFSISEVLFEVVSAEATVGLSYGITSSIKWYSKIIIIILMYAGRCGALTLFSAFIGKGNKEKAILKCPEGNILVG